MRSHITWHIYGLLYREDKDYSKAIACYNSALRYDPDNRNILKDLSLLQLQVRDLSGFLETRRNLLSKDGGIRGNWYSFAFAEHMNNNGKKAIEVLDGYNQAKKEANGGKDEKPVYSYEESEILLYKSLIMEENNDTINAITLLNVFNKYINIQDNESQIYHKTKRENQLGELYIKNCDYDKALECYKHLILDNPNNYSNHNGLQMCLLKTNEYLNLQKNELLCLQPCINDSQVF